MRLLNSIWLPFFVRDASPHYHLTVDAPREEMFPIDFQVLWTKVNVKKLIIVLNVIYIYHLIVLHCWFTAFNFIYIHNINRFYFTAFKKVIYFVLHYSTRNVNLYISILSYRACILSYRAFILSYRACILSYRLSCKG